MIMVGGTCSACAGYAATMPELIHTCYRIGDIDRSVAFYEALGFEERRRMPIRDEAINVFMGLPGDGARLELTYNHGVDSYELGTGYNHIAITADDLDGTLAELAEQGIEPEKPPYTVREGGSRICFVRDPDGYRIELIERDLSHASNGDCGGLNSMHRAQRSPPGGPGRTACAPEQSFHPSAGGRRRSAPWRTTRRWLFPSVTTTELGSRAGGSPGR